MRTTSQLLTLIVTSAPLKAEAFLKRYNMPKPVDINDAIAKMYLVIKRNGTQAMYDIAAIHPDKALIVEAYEASKKKGKAFEAACGCIGSDGAVTDATVVTDDPNKSFLQKDIKIGNALIYGALGLIALTLFIKAIKE